MFKPTVLVILGPTASGKSALAVTLAKKFNGEVVSADSRQIYRGLDIGSGKITPKEMRGIPHHLLDVVNPKHTFTVAEYQKLARKKIDEILQQSKLPILCGGSAFYIQTVIDNLDLPQVRPHQRLRAKLGNKTTKNLYQILKRLDPKRAKNIDVQNPRRLIRAIEIATQLGQVPKLKRSRVSNYNFIIIGLKLNAGKLRQNIRKRLEARRRVGLIKEVVNLRKKGLSWKRLDELGLEYRHVSRFLRAGRRGEIASMMGQLETAIWHYAKRQLTWWKRDEQIRWLTRTQALRLKLKSYNTGTTP